MTDTTTEPDQTTDVERVLEAPVSVAEPDQTTEAGRLIFDLRAQVADLEQGLGRAEQQLAEAREEIAQVRNARYTLINEHERWKERLVERLHREANDRDYCSEFDDVMEDLGLPRRERDYEVTVTVRLRISVGVTAGSPGDARDDVQQWDSDDLKSRVIEDLRQGGDLYDWSVGEVEEA